MWLPGRCANVLARVRRDLVQRDRVLQARAQAAERVVDGLGSELAGLDQLHHLRGEVADSLHVDRRQSQRAEVRLQPSLAGRSVPVAGGLAGSVVSLQPAVEMLGEGLAGDSQLAAFGADLHARTELGRGGRAPSDAGLRLSRCRRRGGACGRRPPDRGYTPGYSRRAMWVSLLWRRAGLPTLAKVLPHGLGDSLEVPLGVAPETHDFGAFRVRPRGLEPPRTLRSTRPSTLRVYQFRHRRVRRQYSPDRAGGRRTVIAFVPWPARP
jgi:hypothetical protein